MLLVDARTLGAERLVVFNGKRISGNGLRTVFALEAFPMPFHVQRDHRLFRDRSLASCTTGSEVLLETVLAVGATVPLIERGTDQRLFAGSTASKVLLVPGETHRFDHFLLTIKKKWGAID